MVTSSLSLSIHDKDNEGINGLGVLLNQIKIQFWFFIYVLHFPSNKQTYLRPEYNFKAISIQTQDSNTSLR